MISINHLKRRISKSKIIPYFLDKDSNTMEIQELAKYYDALKGLKYSDFSEEKQIEIVGDFKLAKSFQSVLSNFYSFRTIPFNEVVNINNKGVQSYSDLRLYIYRLLEKGYAHDKEEKKKVYERANQELESDIEFDKVLWLDHPDNRILHKIKDFDISEFRNHYNSEVLDTLFLNSAEVSFRLTGFDKKIFWICRQNKLLFDISQEKEKFNLKLYGPVELFGKSTKYGYRLANAVPKLMGYAEELAANLEIKNKKYAYSITSKRYKELISPKKVSEEAAEDDLFDSFPEQAFYNSFRGNEQGWVIEREPEPLIQTDVILVPDFCIKRSKSKVFVEIIGFWTKEYKARKLEKLKKLKQPNLILIVNSKYHDEAKKDFADLKYPIVFYDFTKPPSVLPVLNILEKQFTDFEDRFKEKKGDLAVLNGIKSLLEKGYASEEELFKLFGCYTKEEFNKYIESYDFGGHIVRIHNAGFFTEDSLEKVKKLVEESEGKERGYLEELFEKNSISGNLLDPLIHYFNYSVRWKSLGETEIVRV